MEREVDAIEGAEIDPRFPEPMSREHWHRLIAEGRFHGEARKTELIHGVVVVRVSPLGDLHRDAVERLIRRLGAQLDEDVGVFGGGPLAAAGESEPEPDVLVARHPGRRESITEALLVIEVSHTSLRYDRRTKLALYAESGVPEYWIVDVNACVFEVYTRPDRDARRYGDVRMYKAGDTVEPQRLPGVRVAVSDVLR